MTVWQENMLFLEKNAKTLYDKLAAFEPDGEPRAAFWDDNKRMLRVKQDKTDIWLGSTLSAEREARLLFAGCEESAGLVVLLGSGNVKLLPQIKNYFKNIKSLVIIEPSRAIFKTLLSNVRLKKIFSGLEKVTVNIVLDEEPDRADHYYSVFMAENDNEYTAALTPVSYCQLFPVYKTHINKLSARAKSQQELSIRTSNHFRYGWLVNQWRNLGVVAPDVFMLRDIMQKLPVIVVSAGPSLKNNVHLLREIGDRALIIAVGSAMQILRNNGIVPHLRMAIDGGSLQLKLFNGLDPTDCPLLYSPSLYHETVDWYKDNSIQFVLTRSTVLHEYVYELAGLPCTQSSSGASVANCAVFVALASGCRKIILMGQDLCFTGNKMHADGTWMAENKEILAYRPNISAKNIFGENVYTDHVFLSIKTTMENITRWCRNVHYINATEGGLGIEGFENKRLSAVMSEDLPAAGTDVRRYIKEKQADFTNVAKEIYQARMRQAVLRIKEQMADLQKETGLLRKMVLQGVNERQLPKIRKQYDKVRQNTFNERLCHNGLQKEEMAVNKVIGGADTPKVENALLNYIKNLTEYVELSQDLAEEFLAGEEKINIVFEL